MIGTNGEVTFNEAEQKKIDEIIQKAMGRAASDERAKVADLTQKLTDLTAKMGQAEADLVAAKAAAEKAVKPGDKSAADQQVADLQQRIEEMKNARQTTVAEIDGLKKKNQELADSLRVSNENLLQARKQMLIHTAAAGQNFVNMDAVRALTQGNLIWNEKESKFIVVNADGTPKLNAAFDPMTPEEFYGDFARTNPYMVRSDMKGGNGSGEGSRTTLNGNGKTNFTAEECFGPKSDSRKASALMKSSPTEYARLRAEAVSKGLIGKRR